MKHRVLFGFDIVLLALVVGLALGAAITFGLTAQPLRSTGALESFTCTEFSPITGECVVFTNQQERRRYD